MTSEFDFLSRIRLRDSSAPGELYDLCASRVYSLAVTVLRDGVEDEEARWRELMHLMNRLPSEHREAIVLAYYEGLSQSEIAEHRSVPLGIVKTRMRLGMEKLRQAFLEANRA